MTTDKTILCRLELDAFGVPPRRAVLEARRLPEGFAVWFRDERSHPDGVELTRRNSAYDTRAFAQIILDFGIAFKLGDPFYVPQNAWRSVTVTGECGLRAALLSIAFTLGRPDLHFLMEQSDASFDVLDRLIETFDDDWQSLLSSIDGCADALDPGEDLLDLLRHYELPAIVAGLHELKERLGRDLDRQLRERQAEREARVAPFLREIETIAVKYSNYRARGGGSMWESARAHVRLFLRDYVFEHGRMPEGKVGTGGWTMDIDELRKFDRWPPDRPDDPPYCSEDGAP